MVSDRESGFLDGFHCIKAGYQRPLIIYGSSSIKSVVYNLCRIRRDNPLSDGRNYINMCKDGSLLAGSSILDISCITIIISDIKSHIFALFQSEGKSFLYTCAKRSSRTCGALIQSTFHRNQLLGISDQLVKMFVYISV